MGRRSGQTFGAVEGQSCGLGPAGHWLTPVCRDLGPGPGKAALQQHGPGNKTAWEAAQPTRRPGLPPRALRPGRPALSLEKVEGARGHPEAARGRRALRSPGHRSRSAAAAASLTCAAARGRGRGGGVAAVDPAPPGTYPAGPGLGPPTPRRRAVDARSAPMAGKALSLLPPLLLAAAGLAGLLLLCVPTRDVREPPALKVRAPLPARRAGVPGPKPALRPRYGIILDAGSSHTSMFVYKWPANKENDTGIVGQHSSCDASGGGISSYADNPSGAAQSLVECLNQALRDVPKERHAGTPLYLGATAGMRLLNLTSPEASANVLAAVTQKLTQYPFDFRGARILSGQDEGVFGWVTTNYLQENFIKYGWVGRWFRPKKGTLGAMDLGGASTQITFETASPAEDPANEVQLRLYGQHYRVYTHSFLCYGREQVLRRLLASVLQNHGFHPCWPKGYSTHVLLRDVYESPCTAAQRPQPFNRSARVRLSGSGDLALCRSLVAELFNVSSCRFSRCSFNGIFQPPLAGKFIAFSAFFYTVDFLRTAMGLPVETLEQLEAAVVTVCNQTWRELQARAPREGARLPDYCAASTFVQQLLSRGYGFDERAFRGVAFQNKAGDTAVGWALGCMLNLTNLVPAEPPGLRKGTDFSSWVVLLALFGAMLLAAFVLLLCQARFTKSLSIV
ncbi:ectonucleoside triphosphate diphosphohydrolase 2 [Hippopotamus amphibius kiboko]|uniref:ectonucleoside triphosphate diphosphohydrolase 2 n=1 Tax=Hippopotamus amphibius kiboko TaxID=575201 RepID=UPI0025994C36|nr:ectonucleoside triphosphate diphosphohydrolase 2 [Hippopotamus amphibius kiboko]